MGDLFDVCEDGDLCLVISCLCLVHGKRLLVLDGGSAHRGDVALYPLWALDDPTPGALYVVEEEGGVRVDVFLFQDDLCFFDLEGLDVLYDRLGCFLGGHEVSGYSCVFCAELLALWLVLCALCPGTMVRRGRGCVEDGAYWSAPSLCWRAARSCATRSRSSMMVVERSRRFVTNGVHCSANLTKLMKAERMKRVRSASGR